MKPHFSTENRAALTLIVILCSNLLCGVILIRFINQTLHNQIIEDNDWMIGEAINRFDAYVDDISTFGKVLLHGSANAASVGADGYGPEYVSLFSRCAGPL